MRPGRQAEAMWKRWRSVGDIIRGFKRFKKFQQDLKTVKWLCRGGRRYACIQICKQFQFQVLKIVKSNPLVFPQVLDGSYVSSDSVIWQPCADWTRWCQITLDVLEYIRFEIERLNISRWLVKLSIGAEAGEDHQQMEYQPTRMVS